MINTTSARNAVAIATANGWTSPDLTVRVQTSTGSNVGAILHGLDCAKILKALDKLRGVTKAWIVWAYAAEGWSAGMERETVYRHLLDEYYRIRKVRQHGKSALLAIVAMEDYRQRMRSSKPGVGPSQIARMVGFDKSDWGKSWRAAWETMGEIMHSLDVSGLGPIGESLPRSDCRKIDCASPDDFAKWVAAAIKDRAA